MYVVYGDVRFSLGSGVETAPHLKCGETFMFTHFRIRYPNGSLVTELSAIDHGQYIVRCLVQDGGTTLVTGLAAAQTVELAEDQARSRALAILGIDTTANEEKETHLANSEATVPLNPTLNTSPTFSDASAALSESLQVTQPTLLPDAPVDNNGSHLPPIEPVELTAPPVVEVPSKTQRRSKREKVADVTPTPPPVVDEIPFADETPSAEVEPFEEAEPSLVTAEISQTSLNDASAKSYLPSEPETSTSEPAIPTTPIDFSDIIARTNVELKRLGWTNQQGRDYLVQTYGKRSRQLLTDAELLDFLHHLESEPTPED
ncbi:MAG: hypothetical protein F6K28_15615 [Microcoleus sp. SIO2G3]|nr:hypothetical protein [Microcoleus sp. SIO2G3]